MKPSKCPIKDAGSAWLVLIRFTGANQAQIRVVDALRGGVVLPPGKQEGPE